MRKLFILIIYILISHTISAQNLPDSLKIDTLFLRPIEDKDVLKYFDYKYQLVLRFNGYYQSKSLLDKKRYYLKSKYAPYDLHNFNNTKIVAGSITDTLNNINEINFFFNDINDFRDSVYVFYMSLPDKSINREINIKYSKNIEFTDSSVFISKISKKLRFDLSLEELSQKNNLGLEYKMNFNWTRFQNLYLNTESKGILDFKNSSTQNSISFDFVNLSYLYSYNCISTNYSGMKRASINSVGFQFKPLLIESNQKFDTINYSGKLLFVSSLPFLDQPIFWLNSLFNVNEMFLPPTVYCGVSLNKNIVGIDTSDLKFRYEFGYNYSFFLLPKYKIIIYQDFYYTNQKKDKYKLYNLLDFSINYYIRKDLYLQIKYRKGALPPTFKEAENLELGFTISLN